MYVSQTDIGVGPSDGSHWTNSLSPDPLLLDMTSGISL